MAGFVIYKRAVGAVICSIANEAVGAIGEIHAGSGGCLIKC